MECLFDILELWRRSSKTLLAKYAEPHQSPLPDEAADSAETKEQTLRCTAGLTCAVPLSVAHR